MLEGQLGQLAGAISSQEALIATLQANEAEAKQLGALYLVSLSFAGSRLSCTSRPSAQRHGCRIMAGVLGARLRQASHACGVTVWCLCGACVVGSVRPSCSPAAAELLLLLQERCRELEVQLADLSLDLQEHTAALARVEADAAASEGEKQRLRQDCEHKIAAVVQQMESLQKQMRQQVRGLGPPPAGAAVFLGICCSCLQVE
jgi:hypothetical protein